MLLRCRRELYCELAIAGLPLLAGLIGAQYFTPAAQRFRPSASRVLVRSDVLFRVLGCPCRFPALSALRACGLRPVRIRSMVRLYL